MDKGGALRPTGAEVRGGHRRRNWVIGGASKHRKSLDV